MPIALHASDRAAQLCRDSRDTAEGRLALRHSTRPDAARHERSNRLVKAKVGLAEGGLNMSMVAHRP
jgi:hypothetical protein